MYVYDSLRCKDGELTSHSLCNLFACFVRSPFGVLSWVRLLTVSTFRLNSRDDIRGQLTTDGPATAFNSTSIRMEPLNEAYGSKSNQPGVSITVHRSTSSKFGRDISDEPSTQAFEIPKTVRHLHLLATPRSILIS